MVTCAQIIEQALTMSKVIASGENPEAEEATDGLFALQGMFDQWVTAGVFGIMRDVYKTTDYTAKEQEAITTSGSPTITIPDLFDNECCGEQQRVPRDLACIQIFDRDAQTFRTVIYDRVQWVDIAELELTDECPLAVRGQDGLAASLAVRYVEQFGQGKLTPSVVAKAGQFRAAFGNKRVASRDCGESVYL